MHNTKDTYRGHVHPAIPGPSYQRRSSRHLQRQMTLLRWAMQVEKATAQSVLDRCRRSMGWASDVFHLEAHPNTLSPRGAASTKRKISTLKAGENTHSGTCASRASSQELSAQLAGETCSVIDVGDCYPVLSQSEPTPKMSSVRSRMAQGLASLRKSIFRYYSDI